VARHRPKSRFTRFAQTTARASGHPATFMVAVVVIVAWAVTGPLFGFSDTWQLVINTGTTIVTFLMVFLIQNTQNRDTATIQIKLDELIRALEAADNALLDLEELEDLELERIHETYEDLANEARDELRSRQIRGTAGTGTSAPARPGSAQPGTPVPPGGSAEPGGSPA